MNLKLLLFVFIITTSFGQAQTILNADGPGSTYELINSYFAPNGNVVESPDQTPLGSHTSFGRHIDEVFDTTQNKYVFRFISHVNNDNDVSTTSTDRQRVEIKTYASSPANMIGTVGETVNYKWRFKIPTGFQPSTNFTHIHQIKPVNGDDTNPIFSLTVRKSTPNRIELRYGQSSTVSSINLATPNLSLFEDEWVEVTESIFVHPVSGTYSIIIKRLSDNLTLMNYSNSNILTIRSDNTFIRPKWGIYRSIANAQDLRDEEVLFSDFSVVEGVLSTSQFENSFILLISTIVDDFLIFNTYFEQEKKFIIYNLIGQEIKNFNTNGQQPIDISEISTGIYILKSEEGQFIKFQKK